MQATPYWWTGPICGLGNRLLAIAAVKACIGERMVEFPWSDDPSCPGQYQDIFEPISNLTIRSGPRENSTVLETHGWEPITIYEQLKDALNLDLSLSDFCWNFVYELRHLPFHHELTERVKSWRKNNNRKALLVGVHIRRTDRAVHHRDQFRAFVLRKQGLNRELPIHLSALYGLGPAPLVRAYENISLSHLLRAQYIKNPQFGYTVFSDDDTEISGFKKNAARTGVDVGEHFVSSLYADTNQPSDAPLRKTTVKDAVIDLLSMAHCDAIAQNNRASTFSLVASIIGARPILSAKPRYPFWQAVETATGLLPNDPALTGHR